MTSLILALALFQPCYAQDANNAPLITSPSISDQNRIDAIDQSVQNLQNGRPVYTSTPTFKGGVCFGDGTCQTTAASAGTSTTTWIISGSTFSVNYSTSITFAIASSTQPYILRWSITAVNSPGEANWIFNGDTGGNYDTQYHGVVENGGAIAAGDSVHTYCAAGSIGNSLLAGGYSVGEFFFSINPNNNKKANGVYHSFSNRASTNRDSVEGGCEYRGSAAVTYITFRISAGNFVGDVWLEKVNKQ